MGDITPKLGKWYFFYYNGKTLEGLAVEISFLRSVVTLWLRHSKGKEQAVSFAAIKGEA
jgi:hypothetical protein